MVEASGNNLAGLLKQVPDFLHDDDDERLSVCEAKSWRQDPDDWSMDPHDIETLYEIEHYGDPDDLTDECPDRADESSDTPNASPSVE